MKRSARPVLILIFTAVLLAGCADAEVPEGAAIAAQQGCVSCHSTDGTKSVGPTWKGLYGATVHLSDGSTVVADEAYLRESMLDPSAKTVDGFAEGLMETAIRPNSLSDDEVRALVEYIKSLD